MSDSDFPQPPSSGPKINLSPFPPGKEDGQSARIEKTTGALQIIRRPVRIEGEVTGTNRDGTVRIHTEQGDLDVRIRVREGQSLPQEGARVEIDIAPGRPPRQAIIRPAPPESQEKTTQQSSPAAPPRSYETRTVTPQRSDTDAANTPQTNTPPAAAPPPPATTTSLPPAELPPPPDISTIQKPLEIADTVRLLPLPPGNEHLIIRPVPEIIDTIVTLVSATATVIATPIIEEIENEQTTELLRIQSPPSGEIALPYKTAQAEAIPPLPPAAADTVTIVPDAVLSAQSPVIQTNTTAEMPLPLPAPGFFIAPAPTLPIQATREQIPVLPQKQIPVLILVLAEKPTAQIPLTARPVIEQLLQQSPQQKIIGPENIKIPAAPAQSVPPAQNFERAAAPAVHLISPEPTFTVPVTAPAPQLSTLIKTTLPAAALLHHFPVQIPVAEYIAPETLQTKPTLLIQSTNKIPATNEAVPAIPVKIKAIDIFIVSLPQPAVKIFPVQTGNSPTPPVDKTNSANIGALPTPIMKPATPANPFFTNTPQQAAPQMPQQAAQPENILLQQKPVSIVASVIGKTAQNLPILAVTPPDSSYPQNFILQLNAANLPVDSAIEFIQQPAAIAYHAPFPTGTTLSTPDTAVVPTALWQLFSNFNWPVMDDIQQILQQESPQAFESLTRSVPNPGNPARMQAATLFFLAAVRAGDVAGWLGDKTTDILRRSGRADIISRAGKDFAGLQRSTAEPVSQDWRAMALPLAWQNDIHKMMLYWRRGKRDDSKDDPQNIGTRFIFDLNLSRMGPVQLDGLHRQGQKRLDLIVRTQAPLGGNMQQALRRTWIRTLDQSGLSGEVSFQSRAEQFVKVTLPAEKAGIIA